MILEVMSRRIVAATAPRMTAQNPPKRFQAAIYYSVFFYRIVGILRTSGGEPAEAERMISFRRSVITGKSFLIKLY